MNAYNRRSYSGTAPDTSLATGVDNAALTVTVADATGWPDGTGGPFAVIFEPDTSSEEKCWASGRTSNTITLLARGMEGAALAHAASTTVRHGLTAKDVDEANYAVSQTVGQITAKGDLLVGSAANTLTRVAKGSAGQVPVWQADGSIAAGKPSLAESDVTGLVNDLAGKLGAPATAFAKGSVLSGTGTNTYNTVAVSTDGTVLTADSTAAGGVSWQTPAFGLLGVARSTASNVTVSSSAGGATALDSTNASVTFTAPSSGRVLVRVQATAFSGVGNAAFLAALVHGSTTLVAGVRDPVGAPGTTASTASRPSTDVVVSGLTAGQSYTYDAAGGCDGGNGVTFSNPLIAVWAV